MLKEHNYQHQCLCAGRTQASASRGFSFVELLLAMFIFALLSGFAYRAINTMTRSQTLASEDEAVVSNLQRAFLLLERDVSETVRVKSNLKNTNTQDSQNTVTLSLMVTRSLSKGRAEMGPNIVSYSIRNNTLHRNVDGDIPDSSKSVSLLGKVDSFSYEFIDSANLVESSIPEGLTIEIQHQNLGVVRRVIKFGVSKLTPEERIALNGALEPIIVAPVTIGGTAPEKADAVSNEAVILDAADAAADGW